MRTRTSDLFDNRAGAAERTRLERDRYRKALEEIAAEKREHDCCFDLAHAVTTPCIQVAREALAPEGQ